eukprot:9092888-Pyramimonas_sp.AAC.4
MAAREATAPSANPLLPGVQDPISPSVRCKAHLDSTRWLLLRPPPDASSWQPTAHLRGRGAEG